MPSGRQADIGPVRFHDMRHTYGSMNDQRENIYDVPRWMGHSSIQMKIDIYGHPITDRGQEAAAKTDAVLFGVPEPATAPAMQTEQGDFLGNCCELNVLNSYNLAPAEGAAAVFSL